MARPTKYKKKYCDKIIEYFKKEPFRQVSEITTYKDGTTKETIKLIPCKFPTIEGFAVSIGICSKTVLNWLQDNPEFLRAYDYAKSCQKDILTQNGLLGLYNCLFAKFVAINSTDMRDSQEHNIKINNYTDKTKKEVEEIINES